MVVLEGLGKRRKFSIPSGHDDCKQTASISNECAKNSLVCSEKLESVFKVVPEE